MRTEVVYSRQRILDLCQNVPAACLVDSIEYRMAGLSRSFTQVFAVVTKIGNIVSGVLPLCRIKDRIEVLGQYWGEGYGIGVGGDDLDAMLDVLKGEKVMIEYARDGVGRMGPMGEEQAYLKMDGGQQWYMDLFQGNKKDRQILAEAMKYDLDTETRLKMTLDPVDIDTLVKFAEQRLGQDSRFNNEQFVGSFTGVCSYLSLRKALIVATFRWNGAVVGNMICSFDAGLGRLTYLSGFYAPELSGFGKFMYLKLVYLADRLGANEIVAMLPVNRIKRIMKFSGRPLYGFYQNVDMSG